MHHLKVEYLLFQKWSQSTQATRAGEGCAAAAICTIPPKLQAVRILVRSVWIRPLKNFSFFPKRASLDYPV
jgi:hypothetical protein